MKFKKKNKLYSGNIRSIKDIIIRSLIIILFPNLVLIIIFLSVENILFFNLSYFMYDFKSKLLYLDFNESIFNYSIFYLYYI